MIELESQDARNLFIIRFFGHVTAEEFAQRFDRTRAGLERMQPGFALLADLTGLTLMDVDCAPHIEATMDVANKHGIALVVRVIPDATRDIGLKIMSTFHYGHNVEIVTCASLEEAMKVLSE
jgi:anti-anti-sigma regulatory factor